MASLSVPELRKRNNFNLFVGRIRENKPFTLAQGATKVKLDRGVLTELKSINDFTKFSAGQSIVLPLQGGGEVRLTQLYKDSEFSGRTQDTTAKEDAEVIRLNEELDKIKDATGQDFIRLRVGDTFYMVSSCESTPGTPKCDFHFKTQTGYGGHISHKAGAGPRGFQQWSGTSQRVEPGIFAHPETQAFIAKLKEMFPEGMPPGTTVGRRIRDNILKNYAVYGKEFGKYKGENNVDTTLQGILRIDKVGNGYVVRASNHENKNGEVITGTYEPMFLAVYKGDRSDHGIKGARITINPVGGRSVKQFV